ncbi:MAG: ABC transporter permease [Proteobacteria bacterium SW_6_67_9]|nr:MAG: ABC transporter permease [Proteobacteria bacterium SW_6_67_9]
MSPRRILAVFAARNREFFRDRATFAWTILLPVAIVFGFAFAFSGAGPERYTVGVLGDPAAAERMLGIEHVAYARAQEREAAVEKVRRHRLDLLVDLDERRYWVSDASPKGYFIERALQAASAEASGLERRAVPGRTIRYVDWLVPGLLAMNMMFTALFGVGFVIVRYRKNGVLKRFKATPLTPAEFLSAQLGSRLMIICAITAAIFAGSHAVLGFPLRGSVALLLLVLVLGGTCLTALGLIIATRTASEELAGGLVNVLSWPMMFLSGVWFSTEGLHPWLQSLARVLPLTHVIEAARAVMIDGAGLARIAPHLAVLAAMAAAFLAIGAALFRWE